MPKNRCIMVFFAACIFCAQLLAQTQDTNLMPNGNFEQGGTGWTLFLYNGGTDSGMATMSFPATGGVQGTTFCRITVTAISPVPSSSNNWFIQLQNPLWTAQQGVNYHLSFWARSNAAHTIQAAAAENPSMTYVGGTEVVVDTSWKQFNIYQVANESGLGGLSFNFFCSYATGTYDFDNIVVTPYTPPSYPATITIPVQSAWQSGIHRNLFKEMGYADTDINNKVNSAFQQLFFGDHNLEAIYTPVGTNMGYVNTPGGGTILTEGQSYGMMISVMMNRQDIFNNLWLFAKTYMQHPTGDYQGYFSWEINEAPPYAPVDSAPAPDGEEYFSAALLFASKRWGNGTGVNNYQGQADTILTQVLHKKTNAKVQAMIDSVHSMVMFSPVIGWNPTITDVSYHLPGFYKVWSLFAGQDSAAWMRVADSSRNFFHRACDSVTGLMSDLENWDGSVYVSSAYPESDYYHSDAWRVPMNIGFDYAWFGADTFEIAQCVRLLKFFSAQGSTYMQLYTVEGQLVSGDPNSTYSASGGQVACNAVSVLACNDTVGWKFVDALWNMTTPTGTYRYYNGLLYMMGLLHCSGQFKIYGNPNLVSVKYNSDNRVPEMSVLSAHGMMTITDVSGRLVAQFNAGAGLSLAVHNETIAFPSKALHLPVGVYFVKFQTDKGVVAKKLMLIK